MWKDDEAWWAKFIGSSDLGDTKRQPSQGVAAADVLRRRKNADGTESTTLVMEHKSTHSLPEFLVKAIRQEETNRILYPGAASYIGVTYHAPGRKVKRLLVKVVASGDEWDEEGMEIPEEDVAQV